MMNVMTDLEKIQYRRFLQTVIRRRMRDYGLVNYERHSLKLALRLANKGISHFDILYLLTEEYLRNYIHERMTASEYDN